MSDDLARFQRVLAARGSVRVTVETAASARGRGFAVDAGFLVTALAEDGSTFAIKADAVTLPDIVKTFAPRRAGVRTTKGENSGPLWKVLRECAPRAIPSWRRAAFALAPRERR